MVNASRQTTSQHRTSKYCGLAVMKRFIITACYSISTITVVTHLCNWKVGNYHWQAAALRTVSTVILDSLCDNIVNDTTLCTMYLKINPHVHSVYSTISHRPFENLYHLNRLVHLAETENTQ